MAYRHHRSFGTSARPYQRFFFLRWWLLLIMALVGGMVIFLAVVDLPAPLRTNRKNPP